VPKIAKWRSWAPSMTYENAIFSGFSTEAILKNWPERCRGRFFSSLLGRGSV
jgi:hypothetical protein